MKRSKKLSLLAGALALTLVAAACGDDDGGSSSDTTEAAETTAAAADTTAGGSDTTAAGGGDLSGLSGSVTVTGSSTVEPISAAVGELFGAAASGVTFSVSGPGTGDGFQQFCNGEADVTGASRAIKAEEVESCTASGIEFIELQVAVDGLSVITSANNPVIECLSEGDIYALLGPESTGFSSWSDANDLAAELDGTFGTSQGPFPDAPLQVTAPGEESGTYDAFVELVIAPVAEERGQEEVTRPDYVASPNDNVIVEGISGSDTSLGWVGFAFVEENLDKIKPLAVEFGDGCIAPTPETIASGEYPIARPLFIYVDAAKADTPAVQAYVDLYMESIGEGGVIGTDIDAGQVPYVVMADDVLAANRETWASRTTGTTQS